MRRLNLLLLAAVQLAGARSPGFSIHEDLLTFPQFEVVFADEYISEKDANSILESHNQHPTYSADFAQSTLDQAGEADARDNDAASGEKPDLAYTYELMSMPPNQYLCSIPVLQPPSPDNKTANELAKAEEARELSRATASGWELVAQIEDSCLYFMSGWWSYSFCKNREIVQFHAEPSIPNGQPPKRDPKTAAYVLGMTPTIPAAAAYHAKQNGQESPPPAELQVKGDQRYLVQRLEGGTECDLTGRDRTIEVQYHCVPGLKNDRIGWIKEVTICAYLMVVNTPRLCNDVAFLPPEETRANPINCQLIVDENAIPRLLEQDQSPEEPLVQEAKQPVGQAAEPPLQEKKVVNVGGVIVGARKVLSGADEAGKPPAKLAPPKSYFSQSETSDGERFIEVVAQGKSKEEGGGWESISDKELIALELKVDVVEDMMLEMRKLAGDQGWKLELVELPNGVRELRGYIDEEDDEKKPAEVDAQAKEKQDKKDEEGSEEKFFKKKDEL
ncbi:Protein OS-9 [Neonectria ditissima]|uniref:Endoplasmic reticulum lectin n=2 Tax=Eukaryota TaxID=2759 RepID=A0A0P7APN1_9HYPO|nr:Protein OS-9 [Neonectria ditissima]